jgi:hypothetical protein
MNVVFDAGGWATVAEQMCNRLEIQAFYLRGAEQLLPKDYAILL